MSVKVQLPRWIPNSYCPEIDSEWMPYTQWRESYKLAFAFEPPFYANLDGEVWYAYFLSPVDSKLPKNKPPQAIKKTINLREINLSNKVSNCCLLILYLIVNSYFYCCIG